MGHAIIKHKRHHHPKPAPARGQASPEETIPEGLDPLDPNYSDDQARDGETPGDNLPPLSFNEAGKHAGHGQRVGWTVWNNRGHLVAGHGYKLNPQSIQRTENQRNQLFATQGAFYVDDFGPGATQVSLRQLVASGKELRDSNGVVQELYTARGDVQRFMKHIYQPVTNSPGRYTVRFHDNHYDPSGGFPGERIYFPPNAIDIQRSVDLHNVWLVAINMISLERQADGQADSTPQQAAHNNQRRPVKAYHVKTNETLHSLARLLAGRHPSSKRVEGMLKTLIALNPTVKQRRQIITNTPTGPVSHTVLAYHLAAGELITVPA